MQRSMALSGLDLGSSILLYCCTADLTWPARYRHPPFPYYSGIGILSHNRCLDIMLTRQTRTATTVFFCLMFAAFPPLCPVLLAGSFFESRSLLPFDNHAMCTSAHVCRFRGLPHFLHSCDLAVKEDTTACCASANYSRREQR